MLRTGSGLGLKNEVNLAIIGKNINDLHLSFHVTKIHNIQSKPMSDLKEFHQSTTRELISIKDRVRNLVKHWGEDGKYKEAVLKSVIRRFIPMKYNVSSGFVVKPGENQGEHTATTQIDIIVHDQDYPVLFKDGDFIITTPDAVKGIIEVKANLENQSPLEVLKKANKIGQFIFEAKSDKSETFFNGVFSFEGFGNNLDPKRLENYIMEAGRDFEYLEDFPNFKVDNIAFNENWFYTANRTTTGQNVIGKTDALSFSFFISLLMVNLNRKSVNKNRGIWFLPKEIENLHMF